MMEIGYKIITCGHTDCGITFAVPDRWEEKKREDHSTFYCPNGHARAYLSEESRGAPVSSGLAMLAAKDPSEGCR